MGLEERMILDEDVALQEPLVQEELQGAQGGQEVAPQGVIEGTRGTGFEEAKPPAPLRRKYRKPIHGHLSGPWEL